MVALYRVYCSVCTIFGNRLLEGLLAGDEVKPPDGNGRCQKTNGTVEDLPSVIFPPHQHDGA